MQGRGKPCALALALLGRPDEAHALRALSGTGYSGKTHAIESGADNECADRLTVLCSGPPRGKAPAIFADNEELQQFVRLHLLPEFVENFKHRATVVAYQIFHKF